MVKTPASSDKRSSNTLVDSWSLTQHEMTMSFEPLALRSGIKLLSLT